MLKTRLPEVIKCRHESHCQNTEDRYARLNTNYNEPLISTQPKQPLHSILHLRVHGRIPIRLRKTVPIDKLQRINKENKTER